MNTVLYMRQQISIWFYYLTVTCENLFRLLWIHRCRASFVCFIHWQTWRSPTRTWRFSYTIVKHDGPWGHVISSCSLCNSGSHSPPSLQVPVVGTYALKPAGLAKHLRNRQPNLQLWMYFWDNCSNLLQYQTDKFPRTNSKGKPLWSLQGQNSSNLPEAVHWTSRKKLYITQVHYTTLPEQASKCYNRTIYHTHYCPPVNRKTAYLRTLHPKRLLQNNTDIVTTSLRPPIISCTENYTASTEKRTSPHLWGLAQNCNTKRWGKHEW